MAKLTVLIPCKDERHNMTDCIESVREIADEILVADSGSTDGTLELVRDLGGCRIIEREYVNPADFKNWAIPQAAHPWVLLLDADERVTPKLAEEIRRVLEDDLPCDAYDVKRLNYVLGYKIRYSGWGTTTIMRLVRRDECRYREGWVHEEMQVPSGKVGTLKGRLTHHTCIDFESYVARMNRYTTWWARDAFTEGKKVGYLDLLTRPIVRMVYDYTFRGGFLDGVGGLFVCGLTGCYVFLKYAKLWEMHHSRTKNLLRESQTPEERPETPCTSPTANDSTPSLKRKAG